MRGIAAGVAVARRLVDESGGGQVVAVGWGNGTGRVPVSAALALGADRAIVGDVGSRAGDGGFAQAEALAAVIRRVSPGLVIAAADTPVHEVGQLLRLPCVTDVLEVAVLDAGVRARAGRGAGVAEVACALPALVTLAPAAGAAIAGSRRATFADLLAARAKPVERLGPGDLGSNGTGRLDSFAAPPPPAAPATAKANDRPAMTAGGGDEAHRAIIGMLERSGVMASAPAGHLAPAPALEHAAVVVAGGRGLGDSRGFAMVEELAGLLGGAPAASGGAVASGWAPRSWLVGQTAHAVRPHLYLAFGISGASQHLVGLAGAGKVVAVNEDAASPIFAVADLAVVADARQVLARVLEAVSSRPLSAKTVE
ncbi:MAG: FAD-binding protein [Actinomycetota bacterium]|nr:FAD-binding protein [Actinomycetota bacterium]